MPSLQFPSPRPEVQARKFVPGTTRGNVIGPLSKTCWNDPLLTWTLCYKQKKAVYSAANLPLPGGSCDAEHAKDPPVKNDDRVPVFFHESTPLVAHELLHALQGKAILDFSPGSGAWAMAAIRARVPYTGVAMTETRKALLTKRLVSLTLEAMVDSNDDLYEAAYASELQQARAAVGAGVPVIQAGASAPAPQPAPPSRPTPAPTPTPAPSSSADEDGNAPTNTREELMKRLMGQ